MRVANFRIPTEQILKTGESTYKAKISGVTASNALAGPKAPLLTNLKQANFKIGG